MTHEGTMRERESVSLSLKITPTEMAALLDKKDKAIGIRAPLGPFLKDFLRTKTDLFKKQKPDE